MKFGKYIQKNQVPEWSRYYLSYKKLKRTIKRLEGDISGETKNSIGAVEEFKKSLNTELTRIDEFYQHKLAEYTKRLNNINNKYQEQTLNIHNNNLSLDTSHSDETKANEKSNKESFEPHIELAQLIHHQKSLLSALLAIKFQTLQLIQFREMNNKGVIKILKKADKRFNTSISPAFVSKMEETNNFFSSTSITDLFQQVNDVSDYIQKDLQKTLTFLDPSSNDYSNYGAIVLEKHRLLVKILLDDDETKLISFLVTIRKDISKDTNSKKFYKAIEILFEHICYYGAGNCCVFLLKEYPWLLEVRDLDERSIFHKLALFGTYNKELSKNSTSPPLNSPILGHIMLLDSKAKKGMGQAFLNSNNNSPMRFEINELLNHDNESSNELLNKQDSFYIFDIITNFITEHKPELITHTMDIDVFGRRPLHYAALNNFPLIYTSMAKVINTIDSLAFSEWWYDLDGCSPLFYSILKGHCEVLRSILTIFPKCLNITLTTSEHGLQNPLSLACSLNYPAVLKILIEFGSNLFLVDEAGESALHMAARSGCSNCTKILLDGAREDAAALINLKDHESGITALSLAAMEGNKDICELFISLGADLTIEDKKLWRPYEHAMFHGYIELGKLLEPEINEQDLQFVEHLKGINKLAKSFSRKRLINECAVVLTLGRNDIRTSIDPIVFFENSELLTELQNLKLVISVVNINDPLANIDLPARDEEPIVLHCPHPSMPQITFDVVPRYSSNCSEILARGSWQIGTSNKPPAESVSIALLSAKTMNVIGHVNFECTIVTPFTHEAITPSSIESKFHKSTSGGSTRLIGHRGLGANQKVKGESSLQVGENTVLSFITAASLGAEYVEFDVQLTKDKVPVIYHDWTVTESGYDLPINAFTLKQFLSIYEKVYKLKDKPDLEKRMKNWAKPKEISKRYSVPQTGVRNRSKSLDPFSHNFSDVKEKMNNKAGFIENEKLNEQVLVRVKGNNPDTIQAPFTTLEETFQKVPEHIGFNIEVKYPMIDEAEEYDIRGSEIELNTFVDSILSVVYEHLSKQTQRPVMFSSFHPEICLLLNLKQNHFPVFFLNDCGYSNMCDPRCNSLKAAVSFATAHQLEGVVIICDPLLNAPRLITSIKQVGLKCFTYGSKNNDLPSVALQKSIGVDAVIVDSVAAVSRSLQTEK